MPYNPKKGQDLFVSNWSQFFLPQEWDFLNSRSGDYFSGLGSAFDALSPSNDQARLDQFRNQQIQTAARIGGMGGINARWQGLGSGSQDSLQNAANQGALGNVANFQQYQLSPEFAMQRAQGLQGLFQPNLMLQSQNMSSNRRNAHPSGGPLGGFGSILGQLGGMYAGGAFGGLGGRGTSPFNFLQQPGAALNFRWGG